MQTHWSSQEKFVNLDLNKNTEEVSMSLINTKIKPFKNQAFKNGEFIEVTEKDTEGRWSVFFFYPADFTFVCPTE